MTPATAVSAILTKTETSAQTEVSCVGVIPSWCFFIFWSKIPGDISVFLCAAAQLTYSQRKRSIMFLFENTCCNSFWFLRIAGDALVTQYPAEQLLCTGTCGRNSLIQSFNFWTIGAARNTCAEFCSKAMTWAQVCNVTIVQLSLAWNLWWRYTQS